MDQGKIKNIVEAALFCAEKPLSLDRLAGLFKDSDLDRQVLRGVLQELEKEYQGRGIELKRVASGFRLQIVPDMSPWVSRMWEEKPPRYSRALLETLALVAYKQPVTRGDIEQVRGVSVSQNIIRTLLEREWVRVVGHREVPGRPAMYGTTKEFLDYFNLRALDELPPLSEVKSLGEPLVEHLDNAAPEESDETPGLSPGAAAATSEDAAGMLQDNSHREAEVVSLHPTAQDSEPVRSS